VLPYPGGGGETYVDRLTRMDGYRFERTFLAPAPTPRVAALIGGLRAQLAARSSDLLHVHGEIAASLCLPTLGARPSILTIHGLHVVRRLEGHSRRLAATNLRLIVRAASRTICVGDAELAEVTSLVGTSDRLVLVRNGVDPVPPTTDEERAAARTALGLPLTATVGLYLAALDPHKEPMIAARGALEAARDGVQLVLLFAGDGPLRSDLEALAADGPVVRAIGFQPDVRRVLAAADFFVLPSRREGLSFSLLEAMAAGLAPVVSDAPGNTDAVGDAGIVVRQLGVEGYRAAFDHLARDDAARKFLGERARERAREQFGASQMLEGTRAVYEDVLAKR